MANGRIKTFVNNDSTGSQYLFTKSDFHLLQVWVVWMIFNHHHDLSVSTGSIGGMVLDTNVKIHQIDVHDSDEVPVGFEQTDVDGTWRLYKDDDTFIPREYLTVADHVSHEGIHTFSEDETETSVSIGTLVARGWTKPIYVRAVISSPLFEVVGYGSKGPIILPFPHYNMSPITGSMHNRKNQMESKAASPITAPMVSIESNPLPVSYAKQNIWHYYDGDLAVGGHDGNVYSKGGFRSFEKEMDRGQYPYVSDAKSQVSSQFYHPFHSFLYIIPPYLSLPVNLDIEFDVVTGQTFSANEMALFFHSPLFVDSRHTRLLDHIKRSAVTKETILNFKDLVGIFGRDVDKKDMFSMEANRSHTCWLSKYRPVVTEDSRSSIGYGCSLMFNEYDQEINQFISQVNYRGSLMRKGNENYYDYPFRVVTMDCSIQPDIYADEEYQSVYGDNINQGLANRGFPRCFYRTDYDSSLVRAGGHLEDEFRPKESFEFTVFPNALDSLKIYAAEVSGHTFDRYYFDTLNVPNYFTDGKRQVLIVKDPDIYREDLFLKKNPYNNMRTVGYVIVEGYVTVPYEIYSTGFSMASAMAGGTMPTMETLDGDSTGYGNWQNAPEPGSETFTLPKSSPLGDNDTTPPGGTSDGPGGIDDEDNTDTGAPKDDPITGFISPPDSNDEGDDDTEDELDEGGDDGEDEKKDGVVTNPGTGGGGGTITPPGGGGTVINPPEGGFGSVVEEIKYYMQFVDECELYRAGYLPRSPIMDYICCLDELGLNWWEYVDGDPGLSGMEEPLLTGENVDCADCKALFDCLVSLGNSESLALFIMSMYAPRCIEECDSSSW